MKKFFQVYKSQRFRAGKGKMRNRRRIQRKGPLVVFHKDQGRIYIFCYFLLCNLFNFYQVLFLFSLHKIMSTSLLLKFVW